MNDDFISGIEFTHARSKLAKRNELRAGNLSHIPLVRLTHIEKDKLFLPIHAGLERLDGDFRHRGFGLFLGTCLRDSAELIVIDQIGDRWVFGANRTAWIFTNLELAEFHLQRVKVDQPTDERFTDSHDELDGLDRLHDTDDSGQNSQHAAFSAARHHSWRWWLGVEATVARTTKMGGKNRALTIKSEDRAINIRLFQKNTDVVRKVAGRKIIRPIDDDVVRLDNLPRILGAEEGVVEVHLDVGIDFLDAVAGAVELFATDIFGPMQNLALEVGIIHHVKIHQPECADAGGGKVEADRRSQSACADAKHFCGFQALLALECNLWHDQMA